MKKVRIFGMLCVLILVACFAAGNADAVEVIRNGDFASDMNDWVVNPDLPDTWNPYSSGSVSLHPSVTNFYGTILYQNLNVTDIGGVTFTLAMNVFKSSAPDGKTLAVYASYVDNSGTVNRVKLINPDNSAIADSPTPVSTTYAFPADAYKLIRLEIAKEDYGEFYVDSISLTADGVTVGTVPLITDISPATGPYDTIVTITGQNFGTTTGEVFIGDEPVAPGAWSDTAISLTVREPVPSGSVVVRTDFVQSAPFGHFEVTSPYFTFNLMQDEVTAIRGQTVDLTIRVNFNNGFTTADGIGFAIPELPTAADFTPVPVKTGGGVALRIDTSGIAPGMHQYTVQSNEAHSVDRVQYLYLNVVTVSDIKFYQSEWNPETFQNDKTYLTGPVNATVQGQILTGLALEVLDGNGNLIANPAINLRSDTPRLIVYDAGFWTEIYAVDNAAGAHLIAETPDGYSASLPVNISVPDSPKVLGLGIIPETVTNARTDPIEFSATGVGDSSLSYGHSGLLGLTDDTRDWSTDYLTVSGSFKLDLTSPPQMGTYLFNAATAHCDEYFNCTQTAFRVAPLTIVNDSRYAEIAGGIKSLDSDIPPQMLEHFALEFYDASGNLIFSRAHDQYGNAEVSYRIGAIIPGVYKVRFYPGDGSMIRAQWWPNAADISGAQPLTFTAGGTVDGIYFFAQSVPTISFIGSVAEALDFPSTPVAGAMVEYYGANYINPVNTDDAGAFNMPDIPRGEDFSLKITKSGYTTVYSGNMASNSTIVSPLPFALFPDTQLSAWGIESGKGMVSGHVARRDNPFNNLSGATVTAVDAVNPATSYPVEYLQTDGSFGDTQTSTSGLYAVRNVPDGTRLNLTAHLADYDFGLPASVTAHGDALTEKSLLGTLLSSDEAAVAAAFNNAIGLLNLKNITGFMTYVSADYLDRGEDYAQFLANITNMVNDPNFKPMSYTITSTTITGDMATLEITWTGGNDAGHTDTMIFKKEGDSWKLYGNQQLFEAFAESGYQALSDAPTIYWVSLSVNDPVEVITSVHVAGPGLPAEGIALYHDTINKNWMSWPTEPAQSNLNPDFGRTAPALPLVYTFTINYNDGSPQQKVQTATVVRFLDDVYAENVSPMRGQAAEEPLTFSWNGAPGFSYSVSLSNPMNMPIWNIYNVTGTTVAYDGPALPVGFYTYTIGFYDGNGSSSYRTTPFSIGVMGDMDGDGQVTTTDVILGMQILAGAPGSGTLPVTADINHDGKIGLSDVLYTLDHAAGLRP